MNNHCEECQYYTNINGKDCDMHYYPALHGLCKCEYKSAEKEDDEREDE